MPENAKFVLDDFNNQLKNFVKIFPKDYKKILQEKKAKSLIIKIDLTSSGIHAGECIRRF
jgi:glutamate synthase domain-containing protein 3